MPQSVGMEFLNRNEWRLWLEENFSATEVWVVIQKKNSQRKGLTYEEAVEEAVCFGWIDSKMQSIDGGSFRQRFSPRRKNSIWSKKNKVTAEKMIEAGKMAEAGFAAINTAKQNGMWDAAYSSKTAPTVPSDLKEALKENELAWRNFSKFSNSKKLQYVYWIENAKRDETRQKRISEVVKRAVNC